MKNVLIILNGSYLKAVFFLAVLTLSCKITLGQTLRINEFMSSNGSTIADLEGDYSDWIELYNGTDQTINLENFGLSDDEDNPMKWVFPKVEISPKSFLLLWASGKNKVMNNQVHTNFSISASGEPLLLSDADGKIVDKVSEIEIPRDNSFGRKTDGDNQLVIFSKPTPGFSNGQGEIALKSISPIIPSTLPGFYSANLTVSFNVADPNTQIFYTIDGSTPNINSQKYNGNLNINNRTQENNYFSMFPTTIHGGSRGYKTPNGKVAKGTIIRTLAVLEDHKPLEQTFTYFIFPEGASKYTLPLFSIVTDKENLFSDEKGLFVPGNTYNANDPRPQYTGNYFQRGEEWERPINISLFEKDGSFAFQEEAGVRIHGGITRHFPQKAMRIYFRSSYGNNSLNYKLFEERNYSDPRRFLLRASGNDFGHTYFRDAFAQRLVKHLNIDYQAYEPSIVFINGEYWGIHNIRERQDKHYLENLYGVNPDNIDLLTNSGVVQEGDNKQYNFVLKLLESSDPKDTTSLEEINKYIDLENHIDYMISQIYVANTDWPHNNIDYWRERVEYSSEAPKGRDGRFRWLLYDTDHGLAHVNGAEHNTISWVTGKTAYRDQEWPNFIFRTLLNHESYRNKFINSFLDNINTTFNPERASRILNDIKTQLEPEILEHLNRWIEPGSVSKWNERVLEIDSFVKGRPQNLVNHLKAYFEIERDYKINLDVSIPNSGMIKINSIEINENTLGLSGNPYPWEGKYFSSIPIRLSAKANYGYVFDYWLVDDQQIKEEEISLTLNENTNVIAVFVQNPNVEKKALYYWFFGTDIKNDFALTQVPSSYTSTQITGNLTFISAISPYPNEGSIGIMDRVNDPTEINFKPLLLDGSGQTYNDMRGLRVRNPLQIEDKLGYVIIDAPMVFHEKPIFTGAFSRTNNGPESIQFSYRSSINGDWTTANLENYSFTLRTNFELIELNFELVDEAKNNPEFQIRIDFQGNTNINSGNVRFNNIAIEGYPLSEDDLITNIPFFPKEDRITSLKNLYPNPFNEKLFLHINEEALNQIVYIQILDVRGIEVRRLDNISQPIEELDMSHIKSGLYLINVLTRSSLESYKMIKK